MFFNVYGEITKLYIMFAVIKLLYSYIVLDFISLFWRKQKRQQPKNEAARKKINIMSFYCSKDIFIAPSHLISVLCFEAYCGSREEKPLQNGREF